MKKITQIIVSLMLIATIISLTQVSGTKSTAQSSSGSTYTLPAATASSLGGVIVGSGLSVASNGTISTNVIQSSKILFWDGNASVIVICNNDGTGVVKMPITLPVGYQIAASGVVQKEFHLMVKHFL